MFKKLKDIRLKKGMTLQEMADKVGISKAFYCQLENGKRRLSYDTAIKIASVFNKTPDDLFYDDMSKYINKDNI